MMMDQGYDPIVEDGDFNEAREKPKVTYVCGGNESLNNYSDCRLRKGQQARQGLSDKVHALWSPHLLQEARQETHPVPRSLMSTDGAETR